ncbi:hypothetical protein [Methanococcus maripaludis]|uniref:Nucleoside 2-deoxyribosyltransferase n=1 Tax=Methanococcus maripaludis TaxID=39152 RepID=A0A7J9SDG5_METMI|nr:hypothetical protein [Methanococcus maripaludis]MBB6497312.1 hypothetical protein [Methanococcus maripaludis]
MVRSKLKPLYANLLRLSLKGYLISDHFKHFVIENNLDDIWYDYYSDFEPAEDILGEFLDATYAQEEDRDFVVFIGNLLKDIIQFKKNSINFERVIYSLNSLKLDVDIEKDFSEMMDEIDTVNQVFKNLNKSSEIINSNRKSKVSTSKSLIFKRTDFSIDDNLVFIICPFKDPFDEVCNDHIKPTVRSFQNMECVRADDIFDNQPFIEKIWKYLNEARIIIADLTGRNPNVFYELGIANALGKEVILLTQTMEDVPSDLRHIECIVYKFTPNGVKKLENDLEQMIETILNRT